MTRSRSIAVAQSCPVAGDVQANLDEHIRLARLAATEGAEVVVFPELSLTGYELELAGGLAFSEGDPRLSPLLDVAASQGTILVVGAFGSPSGGLRSAGRSAIWSESGELLVQLEANGSGVAVVTETQHGRRTQAAMIGGSTTGKR